MFSRARRVEHRIPRLWLEDGAAPPPMSKFSINEQGDRWLEVDLNSQRHHSGSQNMQRGDQPEVRTLEGLPRPRDATSPWLALWLPSHLKTLAPLHHQHFPASRRSAVRL